MRVNDVFVIMPYDHNSNEDITDMDLCDACNNSNISLCRLQKEDWDSDYINKVLGRYIDGYAGAFTFKKDYKEIAFRELFLKFKKECENLTFEDFCGPCFCLSTVSNNSPVIACYDEEAGLSVDILEDFLRMSDYVEQTTFKMVALFSRRT